MQRLCRRVKDEKKKRRRPVPSSGTPKYDSINTGVRAYFFRNCWVRVLWFYGCRRKDLFLRHALPVALSFDTPRCTTCPRWTNAIHSSYLMHRHSTSYLLCSNRKYPPNVFYASSSMTEHGFKRCGCHARKCNTCRYDSRLPDKLPFRLCYVHFLVLTFCKRSPLLCVLFLCCYNQLHHLHFFAPCYPASPSLLSFCGSARFCKVGSRS